MSTKTTFAIDDFAADLSRRIGGDARTDHYNRVLYSTDASIYQVMPLAVVIPQDRDDVIATIEAAAQYHLPVLPRGGGTSLAGQAVGEAVVIDMGRLDRIIEVNPAEGWVRAEVGVTLKRLNDAMKHRSLMFGPDPASADRAMLGGITGNNSTGSHSILYGMTADHVISMDVILADGSTATFGPVDQAEVGQKAAQDTLEGRIYRQLPALINQHAAAIRERTPITWRRCGGYNLDRMLDASDVEATHESPLPPVRLEDDRFNLAKLIVGSEGTLATVTGMKLNLVPTPRRTALAMLHFDDLFAALEAVPVLLEVDPSAVELLDKLQLDLCRASESWASRLTFVHGDPAAILFTEFYGESDDELQAKLDRLAAHVKTHNLAVTESVQLRDPAAMANAWAIRKAGLGLLMSLRGDAKPIPFIEDVAVPVNDLSAYVRDVQRACAEVDVPLAMYAHASAGCLHLRPIISLKDSEGVAAMEQIAGATADLVHKYRGALSSEHGDGLARSWLNPHIFGDEVYGAFRQVKEIFDPDGRMNPGKIVDGPDMTENLRFGPDYRTPSIREYIDWSADHGYAAAIEMCNGAGVCHKPDGATMCPSYMVTREEEHSTRGRANLLRAALSGLIPREELFGDRIAAALDLCVSCKACKSECPSSVDMARIKFEWQAHHYRFQRPSWRTRLFAHMPMLSRLGSFFAPLANAVLGNRVTRAFLDSALGIDARRAMPRFERAFLRREQPAPPPTGKKVVLYVDTWANFNETAVAQAAWDVLTAAGYEVIVPPYVCCGRTYLSKGFVKEAKLAARRVSETLAPFARAGLPIIGLEPSCILTLRDEHLTLSDHPDREAVAACAVTFEEFAADHIDEWGDLFNWQEHRPLVLHGHCHQKSLVGTAPAHSALGLVSGLVHEIDSGCCGMAGAFGYEKEHYEISKAMAERRLIDQVRGAPPHTTVVAAGTSCRQQIKDLAGRQALHPAQVLAGALKDGITPS